MMTRGNLLFRESYSHVLGRQADPVCSKALMIHLQQAKCFLAKLARGALESYEIDL